ncbi:thiosulfate dehydrogenase [quinone] large subunit [Lentzea xinjiangensis]|uniref:Thiosulfate dehydrogenase [quinone] large subunit n=1 Tax=Lentzea xinjiangensis TaxID=402600 RepID=A0A1H9UXH2_9PSEU|nr:DoxX family membrane protein [Lentzea xinjiangensis]SES14250.1 thiosulfate dehydrogenase [quinone] large subunit [Lentzea xinjiangensis]
MSAVHAPSRTETETGAAALAVLRIATGLLFLWAFFDKAFGLGYATQPKNAWFEGGSPTKGFLSRVAVGPFESVFHEIAGAWWADVLFMAGLLAIGVALVLGIGLRIAATSGSLMMLLMWAAEWPPAQRTSGGEPTMSTNPLIDYHIIYALVLVALAATASGASWGLVRRWHDLPVVRANTWLR